MFSKGTFQRYLFEIETRQQKMLEFYSKLASDTQEPSVHNVIAEFVDQLQGEKKVASDIQAALSREG